MRPVTPKPTTPRIGLWPLAINPEKNVVRFILLSLMAVVALSRRGVPARGRWRANARVRHAGPVRSRLRMAILTRELLVVRRNNVAIRAHRPVVRNAEKSMIENCAQPSRRHPRGVASDASCRIARRHVIWHVGAIRLGVDEVRLMAAVAVGGGIARGVVAPHVTIRAGVHHRPDRTGDRGARNPWYCGQTFHRSKGPCRGSSNTWAWGSSPQRDSARSRQASSCSATPSYGTRSNPYSPT